MIRFLNVIMVCTSLAGLVGVYALKYSVGETASELAAIERQIERQEGELSLLKADWAFLNQPAHVAPIITRHAEVLGLRPTHQEQFGNFDALQMRPVVHKDIGALDALFESLEAGVDPIEQLIRAN
jgi:hypothetical protein